MNILRIYFYLLGGVILSSIQPVSAVENLDEAEQSVIAMFGDSISTGVQFSTGFTAFNGNGLQGFGCPTIYLQNLLRNEGERPLDFGPPPIPCPTEVNDNPVRDRIEASGEARNSVVVNWGEGGTTTVRGVERLVSQLSSTANQFPNATQRFALIHYGTNDIGNGISQAQTAFNIGQMISLSRAIGYIPAISTLLPRSFADTQPLGNVIRAVGQQQGVPVVDMFSLFLNFPGTPDPAIPLVGLAGQQGGATNLLPIEFFGIGGGIFITTRLHPNDQGYIVMIEAWFEQVLEAAIEPVRDIPIVAPIINLLLEDDT